MAADTEADTMAEAEVTDTKIGRGRKKRPACLRDGGRAKKSPRSAIGGRQKLYYTS